MTEFGLLAEAGAVAFTDGDPITRGADRYVAGRVPGTKGQPHVTLRGGHFVQEDAPDEFAAAVNDLVARTTPPR